MVSKDVYTRLREFMDTLPTGFPATPNGVEIKILKKLFTPEQAELTVKLGREAEEVREIAERIGMNEPELARKLEEMAQKGLIFRVRDEDRVLYQAYQFLVGVYEFQLNRMDKEFCEKVHGVRSTLFTGVIHKKVGHYLVIELLGPLGY